MKSEPLTSHEMAMIQAVLQSHPEITEVKLFGSRAKGTHSPSSDIDLALWGKVDALRAEALAEELDELPLPYHFDVLSFGLIKSEALREHIKRVGMLFYSKEESGELHSFRRTG